MDHTTRSSISDLPRQFDRAAREAVELMATRIPMDVWLISRVEGNDFVVLTSSDSDFGLAPGKVCEWSRTLCSQMSEGGPRVACRVEDVPGYAQLAEQNPLDIRSYIGVPILRADGSLFGTLCGLARHALEPKVRLEQPLVEFAASMLSRILEAESVAADLQRESMRRAVEAEFDPLTHLYNRRGWDELFEAESRRSTHLGSCAAVISLDLDELKRVNDTEGHAAGDELLQRTANAIRFSIRLTDVAARMGGDEFAILLAGCGANEARKAVRRLESNLDLMDVRASVGLGVLKPFGDLTSAFEVADKRMRAIKGARKTLDRAAVFLETDHDKESTS